MNEQKSGSFDAALHNLLRTLKEERDSTTSGDVYMLCSRVLREWDQTRGTDWYYPLDK